MLLDQGTEHAQEKPNQWELHTHHICNPIAHILQILTLYTTPGESAVGYEGIADVCKSIILDAVVSDVKRQERRVGLEQDSKVVCTITRESIAVVGR